MRDRACAAIDRRRARLVPAAMLIGPAGTPSPKYAGSPSALPDSACPWPRRAAPPPTGDATSAGESFTSSAPRFSASRSFRLVPGIGTRSGPCASTQAIASCAVVQPFCFAIACDLLRQALVVREIVAGVARLALAGVAVGQRRRIGDLVAEQAAPDRRVGDERNAELAGGAQRLLGRLAVEQRVFALHRGDRMHLVGAADGLRRRFAQAERPHLALLHQLLHGADGVLDRHLRDRRGAGSRDRSRRRRAASGSPRRS